MSVELEHGLRRAIALLDAAIERAEGAVMHEQCTECARRGAYEVGEMRRERAALVAVLRGVVSKGSAA